MSQDQLRKLELWSLGRHKLQLMGPTIRQGLNSKVCVYT